MKNHIILIALYFGFMAQNAIADTTCDVGVSQTLTKKMGPTYVNAAGKILKDQKIDLNTIVKKTTIGIQACQSNAATQLIIGLGVGGTHNNVNFSATQCIWTLLNSSQLSNSPFGTGKPKISQIKQCQYNASLGKVIIQDLPNLGNYDYISVVLKGSFVLLGSQGVLSKPGIGLFSADVNYANDTDKSNDHVLDGFIFHHQ